MPQFADLDGDGKKDIISGSYTQGMFYFPGLGRGAFGDRKPVLRADGKKLDPESALAPAACDWDEDGDTDLVVGFISGPVKLFLNQGNGRFSHPKVLHADDEPIVANDGGPCVADWDGDGTPDLLLGDGEGAVRFYRGERKGGSLILRREPDLVPAMESESAWEPRRFADSSGRKLTSMRPGGRTKPCVADWNCDGKLDLLVGDYLSVAKPDKKLTPAERSKLAILEKREAAYQKRMFAVYEKLMEKARREAKVRSSFARMTIAESKRLSEASMRLYRKDASLQKLSQEGSSISRALAPLRSAPEAHGFVWVYLRA